MVKNLSVAVLDFFFKFFKELPWKGFVPYQDLSGISIDLDIVGFEKLCVLIVLPYTVHSEEPSCRSSCFKELPWEGFIPYQDLPGVRIDLDTVRLDNNCFGMTKYKRLNSFAVLCPY